MRSKQHVQDSPFYTRTSGKELKCGKQGHRFLIRRIALNYTNATSTFRKYVLKPMFVRQQWLKLRRIIKLRDLIVWMLIMMVYK